MKNKAPRCGLAYILLMAETYLCNLYDLWHTRYALRALPGVTEWNPLCRALLDRPYALEVYKYALVPMGLYVLYRCRALPLARWGLTACAAVFGLNTVYQLWMALLYW